MQVLLYITLMCFFSVFGKPRVCAYDGCYYNALSAMKMMINTFPARIVHYLDVFFFSLW